MTHISVADAESRSELDASSASGRECASASGRECASASLAAAITPAAAAVAPLTASLSAAMAPAAAALHQAAAPVYATNSPAAVVPHLPLSSLDGQSPPLVQTSRGGRVDLSDHEASDESESVIVGMPFMQSRTAAKPQTQSDAAQNAVQSEPAIKTTSVTGPEMMSTAVLPKAASAPERQPDVSASSQLASLQCPDPRDTSDVPPSKVVGGSSSGSNAAAASDAQSTGQAGAVTSKRVPAALAESQTPSNMDAAVDAVSALQPVDDAPELAAETAPAAASPSHGHHAAAAEAAPVVADRSHGSQAAAAEAAPAQVQSKLLPEAAVIAAKQPESLSPGSALLTKQPESLSPSSALTAKEPDSQSHGDALSAKQPDSRSHDMALAAAETAPVESAVQAAKRPVPESGLAAVKPESIQIPQQPAAVPLQMPSPMSSAAPQAAGLLPSGPKPALMGTAGSGSVTAGAKLPTAAPRPSLAGAWPFPATEPAVMPQRPASAGSGSLTVATKPSALKKGKKGKASDRLSAVLQRIVDESAPVATPADSFGESLLCFISLYLASCALQPCLFEHREDT